MTKLIYPMYNNVAMVVFNQLAIGQKSSIKTVSSHSPQNTGKSQNIY